MKMLNCSILQDINDAGRGAPGDETFGEVRVGIDFFRFGPDGLQRALQVNSRALSVPEQSSPFNREGVLPRGEATVTETWGAAGGSTQLRLERSGRASQPWLLQHLPVHGQRRW